MRSMESLLKNRITEQGRHGQLGKNQRGFCEGKSCLPDVPEIHNDVSDVSKQTDKGHPGEVTCLQFQKNFEKVGLQRLFKKKGYKRPQKKLDTEGQEAKGRTYCHFPGCRRVKWCPLRISATTVFIFHHFPCGT